MKRLTHSLNRPMIDMMILLILGLFLSDFSLVFADEFRYDSHGKRDPFISPAFSSGGSSRFAPGDLRLEGIIVDLKGQSYAIVNGEIVKEGQTLQGFILKKIVANEVEFEQDGQKFAIPLRQDDEMSGQQKSKT